MTAMPTGVTVPQTTLIRKGEEGREVYGQDKTLSAQGTWGVGKSLLFLVAVETPLFRIF